MEVATRTVPTAGLNAQAPPVTPEDTTSGALPRQSNHQSEAAARENHAAADTDRPGTETGEPEAEPRVPTPGERVEDPTDDANPPQSTVMDERARHDMAANTGLHARASPATSLGTADVTSGTACPQVNHQLEAEARLNKPAGDTDLPVTALGRFEIEQGNNAGPVPAKLGTHRNNHPQRRPTETQSRGRGCPTGGRRGYSALESV